MRIEDVLQRIQGEFVEMPGLRLTAAQAQRLWGLDRDVCDCAPGRARRREVPVADARWSLRSVGWRDADPAVVTIADAAVA